MFSVYKFLISFFVLFTLVDARLSSTKRRAIDAPLSKPCKRDEGTTSIVSGWFLGERWDATDALNSIGWKNYTQMNYAYARTTPDIEKWNILNETLLPEFVSLAQSNNVKAGLALGGYEGSQWWSSHVASADNRTSLVKSVVSLIEQYKLDAIDFAWQFPGTAGIGCNVHTVNDTTNFLSFLTELREDDTAGAITMSASMSLAPFLNAKNDQIEQFSQKLNYITMMDYDIWGFWSPTVGPNAPLASVCAPAGSRTGSATSSLKKWTEAGFPANQIILGLPTYGRAFSVAKSDAFTSSNAETLKLYAKYDRTQKLQGDKYDQQKTGAPGTKDVCGRDEVPQGTWTFRNMIEGGFLNEDGTPADSITATYDNCTETALVYNQSTKTMISYDSPESYTAKAQFVKDNGMRGVAFWEQSGDSADHLLMSAALVANPDLAAAHSNTDPDSDSTSPSSTNEKSSKPGNSSSARVKGPGGMTMWVTFALGMAVVSSYL